MPEYRGGGAADMAGVGPGGVGGGRAKRRGVFGLILSGAFGWAAQLFLGRRASKASERRYKEREARLQNALMYKNMEIQQYASVVEQLNTKNQELQTALYESESEALQRDYEEFKAPDLNNDEVISRGEFNTYIRNYMKAYPHIDPSEYPTFEDFDVNRDGLVTFDEWQEYLYQQQLAEQAAADAQAGAGQQQAAAYAKQQANMYQGMYDTAGAAGGFEQMYAQVGQGQQQRQQQRR
jgi:hypothetical protein